jgi:hypothetical protein
MYIDEKTAQLILDAIAWSNQDWMDSLNWDFKEDNAVETARVDFVRFCKARGIEGVERKVAL